LFVTGEPMHFLCLINIDQDCSRTIPKPCKSSRQNIVTIAIRLTCNRIDNPLLHLSPTQLDQHVRAAFARWRLPKDLLPLFLRAGLVAQNPDDFNLPALRKGERRVFRDEGKATFWDQPKQLKITIFACCLGMLFETPK
jgi:hypothetical protein